MSIFFCGPATLAGRRVEQLRTLAGTLGLSLVLIDSEGASDRLCLRFTIVGEPTTEKRFKYQALALPDIFESRPPAAVR